MNDRIQQLLREADAQAGIHGTIKASDLTARVLRAQRVMRFRRITSTAILILIGALAVKVSRPSKPAVDILAGVLPSSAHSDFDTDPERDIARIASEVTKHEVIVSRLLAAERRGEIEWRLATLARVNTADDVMERAAAAVVFQTDRMLGSSQAPLSAIQAYTQVVDSFPNTASAQVARLRLEVIKNKG